ncbi:MAG: HNH endonuclease [Patescibacteria group bacterium]|nr:HNH endonuclease [Patescibacteria group bacterium]
MSKMSQQNKINGQKIKTYFNKIDKKTNKKQLKKKLDKLWREVALLKYGDKCEYYRCYKTENLNVHHIISRRKLTTRWDLDNAMVLCPLHHTLSNDAAHSDINFKDKILGKYPGFKAIRDERWFTKLELKANTPQKLDLKLELIYLQKEHDRYYKSKC